MRVLITGGFGFVGGRVASALKASGHEVTLASRVQRSVPNWLPEAHSVQWDARNPQGLQTLCSGYDVLIHAAGMNAEECAKDPAAALEINGLATARLVHAAAMAGVNRFIYLSTAHVYRSPLTGDISEATYPNNLHPYATSHMAGECASLYAGKHGLLKVLVIRLSNAFGAPVDQNVNCWMLLVNELCMQAVKHKKLVLRTPGLQQRDFVAMCDVCKAIAFLMHFGMDETGQEVFNVGAGFSMSVLQMAKLVQQRSLAILGFSPELIAPETRTQVTDTALRFCVDKLNSRGCHLSNAINDELDQLLLFCQGRMS